MRGFEAFVTLDKTKPPENRLFTKENILTVDDVGRRARADAVRSSRCIRRREARPFSLPLEGSPLKLVIDRVTENLVPDDTLAASADPVAPAGHRAAFHQRRA